MPVGDKRSSLFVLSVGGDEKKVLYDWHLVGRALEVTVGRVNWSIAIWEKHYFIFKKS
jgi:hypothetical protein